MNRKRRVFPRWELSLPVSYSVGSRRAIGRTTELSDGGVRIEGECPAVGSTIEIKLEAADGKLLCFYGMVKHADGLCFGVEFVRVTATDRVRLRESVLCTPLSRFQGHRPDVNSAVAGSR